MEPELIIQDPFFQQVSDAITIFCSKTYFWKSIVPTLSQQMATKRIRIQIRTFMLDPNSKFTLSYGYVSDTWNSYNTFKPTFFKNSWQKPFILSNQCIIYIWRNQKYLG
jgi:hypothetical protein